MTTLICGGPATGKTTLARRLFSDVVSTDDYLHLGRNTMLRAVLDAIAPGCVVEGCEAPRLLLLGLAPQLIIWVGPTKPTKYPERYHRLIREWLTALDGHQFHTLPRKPKPESYAHLLAIPSHSSRQD